MTTPKEAADKAAAALHQWPDFTTSTSNAECQHPVDAHDMDRDALRR